MSAHSIPSGDPGRTPGLRSQGAHSSGTKCRVSGHIANRSRPGFLSASSSRPTRSLPCPSRRTKNPPCLRAPLLQRPWHAKNRSAGSQRPFSFRRTPHKIISDPVQTAECPPTESGMFVSGIRGEPCIQDRVIATTAIDRIGGSSAPNDHFAPGPDSRNSDLPFGTFTELLMGYQVSLAVM